MSHPVLCTAAAVSIALAASAAHADEVLVAVAANFAGPLAKIGEAFTAASGHTLKLSAGATASATPRAFSTSRPAAP